MSVAVGRRDLHAGGGVKRKRRPRAEHVIVISIDGLKPVYYLEERWPTPAMRQLLFAGAHAVKVRSIFPSLTYPSHTTMATGALPARHLSSSSPASRRWSRNCWISTSTRRTGGSTPDCYSTEGFSANGAHRKLCGGRSHGRATAHRPGDAGHRTRDAEVDSRHRGGSRACAAHRLHEPQLQRGDMLELKDAAGAG